MEKTKVEQEIYGLEKRYWQAIKDNDMDTMLSLTDDPCIVAGPQGVSKLTKKSFTEMMNGPQSYKLKDFKFHKDYQVSVLNADTAVIAYKIHENLDVEGKPISLDLAESSTWRRRDGRWVCSLHTEVISGDPFGRDRTSPGLKFK
jgi:ketosteroid isomerase-like protein